jgi:ubiquinone/menaquinone biosynthesis C-methylase UbiE
MGQYYDEYWSPCGFSPTGFELPATLREVFERYVRPQHRTVDVGCGDGSKAGAWLNRHAASYTGFDVSEEAVKLARERGLQAVVVEDAGALPIDDSSVDIALCAEVLEHLVDPFAALLEIRRVLSPEGTLILTVPNIANWRSRADLALFGRWHPGGDDLAVEKPWRDPHIRFFTRRALVRMLRDARYDVLEIAGLQELSVAYRLPGVRRLLGDGRPGSASRLLVRIAPGLFANNLYAVAKA